MKPTIAVLAILLFCSAHAAAKDPNAKAKEKPPTASNPKECVLSGRSWQECLGHDPSYSITDSLSYKHKGTLPQTVLVGRLRSGFRGPWDKTAIDFLMDPNFRGFSR